jgi:hypothetical protein
MHYITIDPTKSKFEPTTMHYTTIDEPEKTKIRTQDHALFTDTSTAFMVIDDVTAHINPKHLCIGMMRKYAMVIDDVTAQVNPKH